MTLYFWSNGAVTLTPREPTSAVYVYLVAVVTERGVWIP